MSGQSPHYALEDWTDLALGGMPVHQAREMESHRRHCGPCGRLADEAETLLDGMRRAGGIEPQPSLWPEIAARLPQRRSGWRSWFGRRPVWVLASGVTAVLMILVFTLTQRGSSPALSPGPEQLTAVLDPLEWPGAWLMRPVNEMALTLEQLPGESLPSIGTPENPDYDALSDEELEWMRQHLADWNAATL